MRLMLIYRFKSQANVRTEIGNKANNTKVLG